MKAVIADERIDAACQESLAAKGFEIIKLPAYGGLQSPVSAHPDMLIFIGGGKAFCHEKYYKVAKKQIDKILSLVDFSLVLSDERWDAEYPHDVLFNAARVGDKLICSKKSTSRLLLCLYGEENVIDTKQGYAKCSTCTVGENGIITADKSIAKAAEREGIDVLLLPDSCTRLDGYDTGFIGGASGDDGENVFFCGDISRHPEYLRIQEFCQKHGRDVVSLSDNELYDYGSLIFI